MARVFLYIVIPASFRGFCQARRQLDRGPLAVPFPSVLPTLSRQSKARLNTRGARRAPLSFDFARSPTDAETLQTHCLAGVARCRYIAVVYGTGHTLVGRIPCRYNTRLHGSSSPLVSAVSLRLRQVVLINMVTACNNSRLSRCSKSSDSAC